MHIIAASIVIWSLFSALGLFVLSRRRRPAPATRTGLRYVCLVPCLNEGRVISATVRHLLQSPIHGVVVIDDASDDDTADQLDAIRDPRLHILKRTLPDARRGKGAALNAAYRWVRSSRFCEGISDDCLVLAVIDADGRLKPGSLSEVTPAFGDPRTGAAQISVRIRNRSASFWARMQHFEFVAFTGLYQRGRERTGAVGLGGNGQFARLSSLRALGDAPWTDCLTEDMDLGIRMLLRGWRTRYIPTAWVSQQAVPDARRLLRQRTRWFQGTLQCARHLPRIVSDPSLALGTKIDLASTLLAPIMLLVASPLVLLGWPALILMTASGAFGGAAASLLPAYVIGALPGLLLSFVYWLDQDDVTLPEAVVAGHCFIAFGYLWIIAGWIALARQARGRTGWAKTARVAEPVEGARPGVLAA